MPLAFNIDPETLVGKDAPPTRLATLKAPFNALYRIGETVMTASEAVSKTEGAINMEPSKLVFEMWQKVMGGISVKRVAPLALLAFAGYKGYHRSGAASAVVTTAVP